MIRVRFAASLAIIIAAANTASAYTLIRTRPAAPALHWPVASLPVVMRVNDQTGPSLPNLAPGSDPVAAIQRALAKYPAVSAMQFQSGTSSVASAGTETDGLNIISFADTTANRATFEMAGGDAVVGLTLFFYAPVTSSLVEADLLFNPALQFTTTRDTDDALEEAHEFDIEAVATHELGHVIGLHHTGVESATMWALTSVLQRTLDADDIAGARTLYPPGGGRGAVQGHVILGGDGAFGAHVVAVDPSGAVAASALTLLDGSYAIEQLPPATYRVYVEPLDGPHSASPDIPCIELGNLSGAGFYDGSTLDTDFVTHSENNVVVTADQATTLDFSLPHSTPTLNPVQIGPAVVSGNGSYSYSISGVALGIIAGSTQWVTVAGPGVDEVPVAGVDFGPGITVDSTITPEPFTCNSSPLPAMLLQITVNSSVPVGGRAIGFVNGDQRAAFTGALRVIATEPTPVSSPTGISTPGPTDTLTPTNSPTSTNTPIPTDTPAPTDSPTSTRTLGFTDTPTPTNSPISTSTPVPTGLPTETQTSVPTNSPTSMPTAMPTDTPTSPACVGDCDGLGKVSVDELVKGVNIALANANLSTCPAFDSNHDHKVTVEELVQAVNAALNGCPT